MIGTIQCSLYILICLQLPGTSVLFEVLSLAQTSIISDQSIVVTVVWFSLGEEGSPGSLLEAGPCLLFLEGHVPGSSRVARVNPGSAAPQCSLCVAPGPRAWHLGGLESVEGLLCLGFWRALCSKAPGYFRGLLGPVKGLRFWPCLQAAKSARTISWALAGDPRLLGQQQRTD